MFVEFVFLHLRGDRESVNNPPFSSPLIFLGNYYPWAACRTPNFDLRDVLLLDLLYYQGEILFCLTILPITSRGSRRWIHAFLKDIRRKLKWKQPYPKFNLGFLNSFYF